MSDYEHFISIFEVIVHQRPLHDTEKMVLLRQCLQGRAKEALSKFRAGEYQRAFAYLKQRFGKNDLIRFKLAEEIQRLPIARDNPYSLRETLDKIQGILAILSDYENMPCELLVMQVLKKFPHAFSTRIIQDPRVDQHCEPWTLSYALQLIETHIRRAERAEELFGNSSANFSDTREKESSVNATTVAFSECPFCSQEGHSATKCKKYSTLEERRDRIEELRVCFNCLGDHMARICTSPKSHCPDCPNRFHNISICPKSTPTETEVFRKRSSDRSLSPSRDSRSGRRREGERGVHKEQRRERKYSPDTSRDREEREERRSRDRSLYDCRSPERSKRKKKIPIEKKSIAILFSKTNATEDPMTEEMKGVTHDHALPHKALIRKEKNHASPVVPSL